MVCPVFKHRYAIFAAGRADEGDNKKASTRITNQLCNESNLKNKRFAIGNTKIFFKAGVLARLEDLHDEKFGVTMPVFQTKIRWHLVEKDVKRCIQELAGLLFI